jgi:hypothetical protein
MSVSPAPRPLPVTSMTACVTVTGPLVTMPAPEAGNRTCVGKLPELVTVKVKSTLVWPATTVGTEPPSGVMVRPATLATVTVTVFELTE